MNFIKVFVNIFACPFTFFQSWHISLFHLSQFDNCSLLVQLFEIFLKNYGKKKDEGGLSEKRHDTLNRKTLTIVEEKEIFKAVSGQWKVGLSLKKAPKVIKKEKLEII